MMRAFALAAAIAGLMAFTDAAHQQFYYKAPIDHFSSDGKLAGNIQLRYLVDQTYFDEESGPIFLCPGGTGTAETFYNAAGFVTKDLAQAFGAVVVVVEHRYYGESVPVGNGPEQWKRFYGKSPPSGDGSEPEYVPLGSGSELMMNREHRYYGKSKTNLGYLSVEETLEDLADFVQDFRASRKLGNRAVIVFGGSYPGSLAAWLRTQYPGIVQGAWASNAPVYPIGEHETFLASLHRRRADAECPSMLKDTALCRDMYGEIPRYAQDFMGQSEPYNYFAKASNILFSNGDEDPWIRHDVTRNINDRTLVVSIAHSSTCADLSSPKASDPDSLIAARALAKETISRWIAEYSETGPHRLI